MKKILLLITIMLATFLMFIIMKKNDNEKIYENEKIAFFIDNKKVTKIDNTKEYSLEKYECLNNEKVTWDNTNKKISIKNLNKKTECKIYFKTQNKIISFIANNGEKKYILDKTNNINGELNGNFDYVDDGEFPALYFNGNIKYGVFKNVPANYDFANNISLVARFKLKGDQDDEYNKHILSNTEFGGASINILNDKICSSVLAVDNQGLPNTGDYTNGEYTIICSSENYELDTWYTVVTTFDGYKINLYINGEKTTKVISQDTEKYVGLSTVPMTYGCQLDGNDPCYCIKGTISDAYTFNTVLTDAEINSYYSGSINYNNVKNQLDGYKSNENENYIQDETGYIKVKNNNLDFSTGMTYGIRFKIDENQKQTKSYIPILSNTENGGCAIQDRETHYRFICLMEGNSGYTVINSKSKPIKNKWNTAVATYNGSEMKLYINGILEGSVTINKTIHQSSVNILVLGEPAPDKNATILATGSFNEVFALTKAMTENEIINWHNNDEITRTNDFIFRYKVGEKVENNTLTYNINSLSGNYKSIDCSNNTKNTFLNNKITFSDISSSDFCIINLE